MTHATIYFIVCLLGTNVCEEHKVDAQMPPVQCQTGMVMGDIMTNYHFTSQHRLKSYRCEINE